MNAINPILLPGKSFDLNTFTYNGHTLRTVVRGGKPWLVVADILEALGLNRWKASHHRYHMDADEWSNIKFSDFECLPELRAVMFPQGPKGQRPTNLSAVSESGFYKITLRAQRSNPAAREFQDWVTKEVLPRIRRDGAYIMGEEKVATGEVSEDDLVPLIGQAMAKKFNALSDEINARNREKDSYKAAKQTLCRRDVCNDPQLEGHLFRETRSGAYGG